MARDYKELGNLSEVETNMEIIRDAYRHLDKGDEEGFLRHFSDDVKSYEAAGLPYGGDGETKEDFRKLIHRMMSYWKAFSYHVVELMGGGNQVVVQLRVTFTTHSGEVIDHSALEQWTFSNGMVTAIRPHYYDTKLIAEKLAGKQ